MKKILILLLFIYLFSSCHINGALQGMYSYYKRTNKVAPNLINILPPNSNICDIKSNGGPKVYAITGKQLFSCISNLPKAIIYIWSPKCKSKFCYSLDYVQNIANLHNTDLYIVSEYYDSYFFNVSYNIKNPILGINTESYKTNLTRKYMRKFYSALKIKNNENYRILYFEFGILKRAFNNLEEI